MSQATRRRRRIHTCKCIDSESCSSYPIASSCVSFYANAGSNLQTRNQRYRRSAVLSNSWTMCEVLEQENVFRSSFSLTVEIHQSQRPEKEWWWSKDWAVEQHVQSVKSPSQSIRQPLLVRVKLYANSGLTELACCVQHGGKSTGCHIHLDFYECFDSSPKGSPLARWWVFIKACQKGKKLGGRIFADLHCTDRKKKSCHYSNCNWK